MSKLILVPTPIGNLKDITFRALEVLGNAGLILAEDTRQASKLLNHYNIRTPLQSHHMFNEHKSVEAICNKITGGLTIALISDAGTPGISDPGFLLVRTCIEKGIEVETLPGPTALVPALVNSGLPCDRFCFEGFLPQKKGRNKRLSGLAEETRTMIFYESPYRLVKALNEMSEHFGPEREASVSRELSKIYEENIRGSLAFLADYYREKTPKGEIVIVVAGKKA
jgi:16S rRNA (cytidine1402-2'-O)-methyltransferase